MVQQIVCAGLEELWTGVLVMNCSPEQAGESLRNLDKDDPRPVGLQERRHQQPPSASVSFVGGGIGSSGIGSGGIGSSGIGSSGIGSGGGVSSPAAAAAATISLGAAKTAAVSLPHDFPAVAAPPSEAA